MNAKAIADVIAERARQDAKWGEQNHRNGTGGHVRPLWQAGLNLDLDSGTEFANRMRFYCENSFRSGEGTWRHILLEEVAEALAEGDPARLRAELVQVAAVAVAWIEKLDREGA